MGDHWPLVGRATELERVDALLRAGTRGVVFAGPPGVGKTRLGTEALGRAVSHGLHPLHVTATQSGAALPLGAFAALLPEIPAGGDRADLLRRVAQAIAGRAEASRVALFVDDAHLLDEASAALVHHLASDAHVFLLVAVRSGEHAPDAVVSLWKDELAERLELHPLGPDDVEAVLAAALGGAVDGATVHLLQDRTEGNVLFLRELVVAAVEAGVLRQEGGLWRLRGKLPASARLVELVETRLGGLLVDERETLELLAVGEPVGVEILERVAGSATVRQLERRDLFRVERQGRRFSARLGHPVYGDVLRARLSPLRIREMSRALADALTAVGARRREDVLRLATWRLLGGGDPDPELMLAGARQAHARYDLPLTERLAAYAWETAGTFDAGLLLGAVMSQAGRPEEAESIFAALVPKAPDDESRAALAVNRSQNFLFLRRVADAITSAEEAEAGIVDLAARAEVGAQRSALLLYSGRVAEARDLSASMLSHAVDGALVGLCVIGAYTSFTAGNLSAACRISELGLATHLSVEGPPLLWTPGIHRFIRLDALSLLGELRQAEGLGLDWYRQAVEDGSPIEQAYVTSGLSKVYRRQGKVRTAARWARLSEGLFRDEGRPAERSYDLVYLAHALALAGAEDEAVKMLDEFDSLPGSGGAEFGPEVLQARAWVRVAGGDVTSAVRLLGEAADAARAQASFGIEGDFLHDMARLGYAAEVAPRLAEVARVTEGGMPVAWAAHAAALVAQNPTGLEAVSTTFEQLGGTLLAAEAAADAAVAWRSRGDRRKTVAAEQRAATLAGRCEGALTPALTTAPVRATLTARELEVARLAAAGVPNKEIAARLYLSVHTVQNQLHSAYEKLGVEGRAELGSALEGY